MVFSSTAFLFAFLPFVLIVVYPLRRAWQNAALLALSILFYVWGAGADVRFIFTVALVSWCLALVQRRLPKPWSSVVLAFSVLLVILPLLTVKYVPPMTALFDPAASAEVILPLGISFFTFHAISYLVDVARGQLPPERRIDQYFLYLFMFPHQIAGPIVRYGEIRTEIKARLRPSTDDVIYGLSRFSWGLAKKAVIADACGTVASAVWADAGTGQPMNFTTAWIGAIAFTTQIYFDFSGYSDMAIGLARVFGFHFPENFASPYRSASATEFWRRWHMTLSRWFRDYVYIPLGGNRHGVVRSYIALIITFALTSLWHGATVPYLIWGGLWSAALMVERVTGLRKTERLYPIRRITAALFIVFTWVAFRSPTMNEALGVWRGMVQPDFGWPTPSVMLTLTPLVIVCLVIGVLGFAIPGRSSQRFFDHLVLAGQENVLRRPRALVLGAVSLALGVIFSMWTSFSPFLYFQF